MHCAGGGGHVIYLSGHAWALLRVGTLPSNLGVMVTYNGMPGGCRELLDRSVPWAADNGCFANPGRFSTDGYLTWLESMADYRTRCLFATARDVLGNAEATLDLALPMLPMLRSIGYRAALVAQDGLEHLPVPWDAFDVLFIGGTTAWKLGPAWALVREAKLRGKYVHVGRVNSLRRVLACQTAGVDSTDGTFVAFGPDKRYPELLGWLDTLRRQPALMEV